MKKPLIISLAVTVVIIFLGIYTIVQVQKKTIAPTLDPIVTEPIEKSLTFTQGRQCYVYAHEGTPDAPYTTSESIDMTITGTKVIGTKQGTQSGPDMTNGYTGSLTGTIADDTMTVDFAYTVEGSKNTEQEIYIVTESGMNKLQYPLIDKYKTGLVPDTTKPYTTRAYRTVVCD